MATSTIKPAGGGDYTTVALWAAAKGGNAGTEDAVCFAGNVGGVTINAWTPSSSTISADSSARHSGVDVGTSGLAFFGNVVSINDGVNWTIQDMMSTRSFSFTNSGDNITRNVTIDSLLLSTVQVSTSPLIYGEMSAAGSGTDSTLFISIRNSAIIAKTGAGATRMIDVFALAPSDQIDRVQLDVINCTLAAQAAVGTGIASRLEADSISGEAVMMVNVINTAIFGTTTCLPFPTTTGPGLTTVDGYFVANSATSDATGDDFGGAGNLISQSSASWFTSFPTDLTLPLTSPGFNAGRTNIPPTDDIIGTARPQGAAYDIGAFERVVASAANKILNWLGIF